MLEGKKEELMERFKTNAVALLRSGGLTLVGYHKHCLEPRVGYGYAEVGDPSWVMGTGIHSLRVLDR